MQRLYHVARVSVTWWCSATGVAWEWRWQPYPGVWLLILLLLVSYFTTFRGPKPSGSVRATCAGVVYFVLGVLAIWIAADWPIGALGSGYLVSLHTVQYLLLALVAPPLILLGTPRSVLRSLLCESRLAPAARILTHPAAGLAVFNAVLVLTHLPGVVDALMPTQLGSFVIDIAWLVAGFFLWWPALGRLPELARLSYPARIGYLFLNTLLPTVPAAFLTFADFPIYSLYELAPPLAEISRRTDQQVAGLSMKIAGDIILLTAMSILFFKWNAEEEALEGG